MKSLSECHSDTHSIQELRLLVTQKRRRYFLLPDYFGTNTLPVGVADILAKWKIYPHLVLCMC